MKAPINPPANPPVIAMPQNIPIVVRAPANKLIFIIPFVIYLNFISFSYGQIRYVLFE